MLQFGSSRQRMTCPLAPPRFVTSKTWPLQPRRRCVPARSVSRSQSASSLSKPKNCPLTP
jgi:hypothetical protein